MFIITDTNSQADLRVDTREKLEQVMQIFNIDIIDISIDITLIYIDISIP